MKEMRPMVHELNRPLSWSGAFVLVLSLTFSACTAGEASTSMPRSEKASWEYGIAVAVADWIRDLPLESDAFLGPVNDNSCAKGSYCYEGGIWALIEFLPQQGEIINLLSFRIAAQSYNNVLTQTAPVALCEGMRGGRYLANNGWRVPPATNLAPLLQYLPDGIEDNLKFRVRCSHMDHDVLSIANPGNPGSISYAGPIGSSEGCPKLRLMIRPGEDSNDFLPIVEYP